MANTPVLCFASPNYDQGGTYYIDGDARVLVNVHRRNDECEEHGCSIHAPSDHPLAEAPTRWDGGHMRRICPEHGIAHLDPDHLNYLRRTRGERIAREVMGFHNYCCGCCGLDLVVPNTYNAENHGRNAFWQNAAMEMPRFRNAPARFEFVVNDEAAAMDLPEPDQVPEVIQALGEVMEAEGEV